MRRGPARESGWKGNTVNLLHSMIFIWCMNKVHCTIFTFCIEHYTVIKNYLKYVDSQVLYHEWVLSKFGFLTTQK